MTKRFARIAVVAAAAASFAIPATPASAAGECWSFFTTPVECAKQLLEAASPGVDCVQVGHTDICLPPAS